MQIKFIRKLLLLLILSQSFQTLLFAQALPIKVEGDITEDDRSLAAVAVQVVCNGKVNTSILSDANGEYSFKLPQGKDYYIVFTKDGYVSKRFTVSTRNIPKEIEANEFSTLTAKVVLFKKVNGVDYSPLSEPMVKYYFDPKKQEFAYDMGYLNQMLAKLEIIKEAERLMKAKEQEVENQYHNAIKAADRAFEHKEYRESMSKYKEALAIKPKEIHPQTQINILTKLISDEDLARKELSQRLAKEAADAETAKQKAEEERKAKELLEKDAKSKLDADRLAKEKVATDAAKAKAESDRIAKEKADAEAKMKAESDRIAKEKAAAAALIAKNEAELVAKQKVEKESKIKAEAALKTKIEDERIAKEKAAIDSAKAVAAMRDAKAKAEEDKLIKEFLEKEAKAKAEEARLAKEKEIAEQNKRKAEEARIAKELIEADRVAKEKAIIEAAKAKSEADRIAKEKAEANAKAKALAEQETENKAKEAMYKAAIVKGDEFFKLKKYMNAEGQYQTALTIKGGDEYAKLRLMECEKLIRSDSNQKTDERQKQLLAKYPEGVTEEIIPGDGVLVIKRVLVKSKVAYVYEKKIFNWGGIACFRDGSPIPETVFEFDTKK